MLRSDDEFQKILFDGHLNDVTYLMMIDDEQLHGQKQRPHVQGELQIL